MRKHYALILLMASSIVMLQPVSSHATHAIGSAPWDAVAGTPVSININAGLSYSTVKATELVYDDTVAPGYKLSELDWDSDVTLATLSGSLRYHRWVVNAGVWSSFDSMNGSLTDRDWMFPDTPAWSDQSIGSATIDMTSFDLNAGFTVWATNGLALDLVLGYRQDDLKWKDFGGTYIYSENGFRDSVGSFDPETGIAYEQHFRVPYVGAHAYARVRTLTFSGYVLYSPIADINDTDYHILRDLHFKDTFSNAEYTGIGAHATWHITSQLQTTLAVDYQHIPETVGDETVVEDGESYSGGAGIALETTTTTLTVGYTF